jgi:hypothetical protein
VNRIKGFFIPESSHVVGTIMCMDHDLLKQPNGTWVRSFWCRSEHKPEIRMNNTITLVSGANSMTADLYTPPGASQGLIVIAYGSDGLTDDLSGPWKTMIQGYATSLADRASAR